MTDKRNSMDRALNIENIRRRHTDAKFLNEKGDKRKQRIKEIQEKYKCKK